MSPARNRAPRKPLDPDALNRLALHYVGRYATTRAKLASYLKRKVAERGWAEDGEPPISTIVVHCADLGYVDDRAFADARSSALGRRGYGARRIGVALAVAGIDRDLASEFAHDEAAAFAAAEAYARRKRIGPFADEMPDPDRRRRMFAAMMRAGHDFGLTRAFIDSAPGSFPKRDG